MAIRFVIGRAGTGKTYHCLEGIRDQLRRDPVHGPRLIFLVPEQAGLQMERAILAPPMEPGRPDTRPAAHRAEVLSFKRLAYRVLESTGTLTCRALSEPARAMVLRHLVAQNADGLRFYRRVARHGVSTGRLGGFVDRLSETIGELIEEAVSPDELLSVTDRDRGRPGASAGEAPIQQAKLHDLHVIYKAYLDYLGTERLDPSQFLETARAHLARCAWVDQARLWVDGFASLSGQETLTLVALAERCQRVDITVLADPSPSSAAARRGSSAAAPDRLFARTARTISDLRDRFVRAGLEVDEPLVLSDRPRFEANPALMALERSLGDGAHTPTEDVASPPRHIELLELPSRRLEVEYAVSRIAQWVQGPDTPYRYRDIAVITRDLTPYHDLLAEAMTAREVPFFIDRRRTVAHHPLVELLRTGATVAADAMSLESVRLLLKTGLLPLSLEAADELETYLLARGISGSDRWQEGRWTAPLRSSLGSDKDEPTVHEVETLECINRSRTIIWESLQAWFAFASSAPHAGQAWVDAILCWQDRLGVPETLKRWVREAEGDGDLDQAEEHRQVWRELASFLNDFALAFAEVELRTEELSDILEAGLSKLTLGLVPPTVDQVLVGSVERSRHPDIKAAVVVGLNDGAFPKQATEDSILNDEDRTMLEGVGVRVGSRLRERVLDESLLFYVAMTRASERLVVTYATADEQGRALRPSPLVRTLRSACSGLAPKPIGDPARQRETWDILSARDLSERLAREFRTRPERDRDDRTRRGRFNELYDSARGDLVEDAAARRAMVSLDESPDDRVAPAIVQRFCGGSLRTSVSELETYAACPFQHFARYTLGLRERAEAPLEPIDVGRIHHAVLEDFVRTLCSRGRDFAGLSEEELLGGIRESCSRIAMRLPEGGAMSDARSAYVLRRCASQLARMLRVQRKRARSGTTGPRAAELSFGFDDRHGLPALELSTPAGRRVVLRGYIDRVDLAELGDEFLGIVVDYKQTRDKRLHLGEVYHGLSLQLLGYLLVLAKRGETLAGRPVRPIGALYVSLASRYHLLDHPDQISSREQSLGGTYRPRGLLMGDAFDALDRSADTGWSDEYSVYRKKDGTIGHIDESDAADAASFRALLDHTRTTLGRLADGVLDGDVGVRPYRLGSLSPCSWCAVAGACRFDMGISEVRFLETLKRSEVFRRLTGHLSDPPPSS